MQIESLYLFLASSLNVELVYIILTSISKFANVSRDQYGNLELEVTDDIKAILSEDNKGSCTLMISEIEISDPKNWSSSSKMENYI